MKRREQSQTEQLRRALSEREAQLQEAQARLAALESSTSLQVGRALAEAARRPGRGLVRLPRDLFRLWRGATRTTQVGARRRRSAEPVRSYDAERQEARLLSGTAGAHDDRLVVAGVLSPEAHAAIEPYVRVVPLRPHDAQVVFDSIDADVVLVTASAASPGTPWAHVGDPAVADRTRALHWVVSAAASRGVPSVLVRDTPAPPALVTVGFDHVHDGDLGVPLHRFNPIAAEPEREPAPVHVPAAGRPRAAVTALLGTLAGRGLTERSPGWGALPETLRGLAGIVVADRALARRALVCGTRALLLDTPRSEGDGDLPDGVLRTAVADAGSLASGEAERELSVLRTAGALTAEEVRAVLRAVFLADATPARLAEILGRVELAPGAGGAALPLRHRRVALLAAPADDVASLALADDVLNQLHAPAEVVVPRAAEHFAGVERLRSHGVPLRTAEADAVAEPAPRDWAALARAAEAPWTALWRGTRGSAFLADTLCAAECSGADAVGPAIAPWSAADGSDAVNWSAADQDYVFVSAIEPELARRELVLRGLHPGVWNRHGARLLALGPARETGRDPEHGRVHSAPSAG
ncbi:hypothetical protein [Marinitenerispora sediminis]|uniref:Uncharacterized protein n=1 Tax=Marinitenerispora sediminis TaxID=1931232 RepID=A0A368T860_9ACTN|nr:hypothetical protein [Marinitenerispora sediminis]RCV54330.1 hypothetical protein DEF28_08610 [Marinitenerispora sediminis]RCV60496.1 hypothetical protein DEF24_06855 [Marinitenerispora sediminis]RCV61048.1 hypothetical protein DEF23_03285 [Marinitenerispora sediminis]